MAQTITPAFFYGSAAAAAAGLLLGAALHGPWQPAGGFSGPRILFSQAEAAEVVRALPGTRPSSQVADVDPAAYESYLPATPLPVTRLDPDRFGADQAGADADRESMDDARGDAGVQPAPDPAATP